MKDINYKEVNRESWNNRTEAHINSDFYDNDSFIKGKNSLNSIELDLLGDVKDKSILHLQCHFGQDTISLARMGAKVTGVDLSDRSIEKARELATITNTNVEFIRCDIFDLPKHLDKKFDIVFTSYGVIGWLPDIAQWASIVARFLKANGKLVFVEFHPVVWMFDDDFKAIKYRYFNSGPILETEEGTYANPYAPIQQDYVMWNHGMSEVVGSLLNQNMELNVLKEYDYSPYNCFNGTIEVEPKKYRIEHLKDKIPIVYAIVACKKRGALNT